MYRDFGISHEIQKFVEEQEEALGPLFSALDEVKKTNNLKILKAMQDAGLSDHHFHWNTGYAYDDQGRDATEKIYSQVFDTEDALVRPAIASGTHAITLMLTGILRPGDHLLTITGTPYDTLLAVIGTSEKNGSTLIELGVEYDEIPMIGKSFDVEKTKNSIKANTKVLYLQRSQGYSFRETFSLKSLEEIISIAKSIKPDIIVALDNCYGEFTNKKEPTSYGVDIMAGSLIKNPGGGLTLSGGYIVGKKDLITLCSHKLTSPSLGKEVGGTFGITRTLLQGLFFAPTVVYHALQSALLFAKVFSELGYDVKPSLEDKREDIIQAIMLKDPNKILAFCEEVQKSSPVDSHLTPIPWAMPGYDAEVIMAAGTFIQGASIELSADAPMREPYVVYIQGALLYEQAKLCVMRILERFNEMEKRKTGILE
ncbi:MAG TPA: methionine gamma-lyase family protein [Clostridia bacterium]|nr:methionine gamma-lyase family protein [Clostridia bacterium]